MRIERFVHSFMEGVRMVPKNHACHTVAVGAPRARNASRHSRVFWEFPSKCTERMVQWARFFCVLRHIHAALASNTVITKRDIYYRDPTLFQSQCRVDSMIVRICMTLSCSRASLNITASARSVVVGPIRFHTMQNSTIRPERHAKDTLEQLIPDPSMIRGVTCHANWILMVEKHAVFQTLCSLRFLDKVQQYGITCPGLLMTGKGYPDHAARWLLHDLVRNKQCHCVYFLVDSDPHGIDIIRTYCEALDPSDWVCMRWLGIKTRQWMQHTTCTQMLPMSRVDRNKAMHVLNHRTHLPPLLRREVAAQLHAGYKCEIEALGEAGGDNMIEFICHQMQQCTPVLGFDGM